MTASRWPVRVLQSQRGLSERDAPNALARAPVPDLERRVHAGGDELGAVKLQRPDAAGVPLQDLHDRARFDVPHARRPIP